MLIATVGSVLERQPSLMGENKPTKSEKHKIPYCKWPMGSSQILFVYLGNNYCSLWLSLVSPTLTDCSETGITLYLGW